MKIILLLIIVVFYFTVGESDGSVKSEQYSAGNGADTWYINNEWQKVLTGGAPYQVYIQKKDPYSYIHCSGVILSTNCILTTATCVFSLVDINQNDTSEVVVTVGALNIIVNPNQENTFNVKSMIVHKDYAQNQSIPNNLAIFVLDHHITFNRNVHEVKLPFRDIPQYPPTDVIMTGWNFGRVSAFLI